MSTEQLHELAVIDSQIDDYQTLVDAAQADGMEVILLSGEDGIDELADAIANQTDIDALHLFTHGSQGQLQIGDDNLSSTTLDDYAEELALIKGSLSDEGDILLYGCNVAEGDVGEDFIEQLALVTGADIAASDDLTGNSELGGDWELERTVGLVAPSAFQAQSFSNVLLGTFDQYDWTDFNGTKSKTITLGDVNFTFTKIGGNDFNKPIRESGALNTYDLGSDESYATITIATENGQDFYFDSIRLGTDGNGFDFKLFLDGSEVSGTGYSVSNLTGLITYNPASNILVDKLTFELTGGAGFYYLYLDDFKGTTAISSNAAPTIAIDALPTYNEGTPVTIDSSVTIGDTDGVDTDLDDGYISFQITSGNTTNDRLILDTSGAVSLSGTTVSVSGTDVGTLVDSSGTTGDGTVENGDVLRINFNSSITGAMAETIAESIQFSNTSDAPNTSNRTVTYTISDGTDTGTGTATVAVTSINDAPSVSTNSGLTVNEGAVGTISDSILNTTDPDDSGAGLTYTITTGTGYGSVWIDTDGNNEINGGESALAINGTFTQQDINDDKVKYLHNGSEPASESFVFSVQDGGEDSVSAITGQTFSITVNQVNDAPTATGIPASITVNEDTASNVDLSDVSFADAEDNNLTVTLSTSAGTLTATSKDSVTVGNSGTGALTLYGSAADINAYLDTAANIQYTGATNAAGVNAATLTIAANDGTVNPTLGTVNIDITAVNDAPTITDSQSYSMTAVNEETASSAVLVSTILAESNINYADVDTGANS
ncbi:MAG: DUF4347 domain-containing protein, partial [Pseudomonadota bacterium]|nr:DUF4347 domain-containing protein [Pseudomonadota bacterium]